MLWAGLSVRSSVLDLRRFVGAIWPYRECLLSVVCFSLSLWEMVLLLLWGAQYPRVVETLDFSWFEASCN